MDLEARPPTEMDSTQAASNPRCRGAEGGGPDEGGRKQDHQTPLHCADGQGTARRETPEPGTRPAQGGTDQPQITPLPSLEYLNSTAWGTIEDDIQLDEHFVVFNDAIQILPSAGAEVVYYWDRNPTGVRDPNTGLEF